MRVLVPLLIVAVVVVGALIAYRMHNRSVERKRELATAASAITQLREQVHGLSATLEVIEDTARAYAESSSNLGDSLLADAILSQLAEPSDVWEIVR